MANDEKVFDGRSDEAKQIKQLEKDKTELIQQIGQLIVAINWFKKASMIFLTDRKTMIDREDKVLSICNQCMLLSMSRSTQYYTPCKANDKDLALIKGLDILYMDDPSRGTRRMAKELNKIGYRWADAM